MLKEKLGIVLITYNRKQYLEDTLNSLFSEGSPVKECEITVLDNNSTDGTGDLIEQFVQKYPNLRYVKNKVNIGGNPNASKAYAEYSDKDYIWILCDNDKYCWDNFSEIEGAINEGYDVVFTQQCDENIADIYYKATFIPACIYKTQNITPTVIENMYCNIRFLFPHLALIAWNINKHNRIFIPKLDIITQTINPEDNKTIFNRGLEPDLISEPRRNILWLVGYINSVELITDKKSQYKIIEGCRHYHQSLFDLFKTLMIQNKYDRDNYKYNLCQIFRLLNFSQKIRFIAAYLAVNLSIKNYKFYEIRTYEDWTEYLETIGEKKYIEILSQVLKNKKVILYGAGIVSRVLIDNYDLSKMNIAGISDKRFEITKEENYKGYNAISPSKLKETEFDCILFTMKLYKNIENSLRQQGLDKSMLPLIKKDRKYVLRIK